MSQESSQEATPFHHWAIVEIMGRQTYAGLVSEQVIAGQAFIRVDVPEGPGLGGTAARPAYTKFFGPGSVYCITPVDKDIALKGTRYNQAPVSVYMLPASAPPTPAHQGADDSDFDDDDIPI